MIRWRWGFFVAAILMLIAMWPASGRLHLDRSLHRMFAAEDPIRIDFETLQSNFGVSDLVVFAYRDPDLWQSDGRGLDRLKRIRQSIEQISGIASAMDLSKLDQLLLQLNNPLSSLTVSAPKGLHPLIDPTHEFASQFKNLFEGQTHSVSSDLVAIACLLNRSTEANASETIRQLRRFARMLPKDYNLPEAYLVGQPVMVEEGFDAIELDGRRLGYCSTISLFLLILIGFRSLRWAFISIAVVQWSLIVTRGLLVWCAWDLTMVSSMLTSIVTVIGVATTMHWMLGYQSKMQTGLPPESALKQSMRSLWRPIAWACITDAIGFIALAFAKVGPVQDYGWMMALASMVVLCGIFVVVPTLALAPILPFTWSNRLGLGYILAEIPGDDWMRDRLHALLQSVHRNARIIVIASILLSACAVAGTLMLRVETDFIKNFRSDSELVTAYQAIEKELGGAGVWDIVLPAPKRMDEAFLAFVRDLEARLRAIEIEGTPSMQLTHVMSFADADHVAQKSAILGRLSVEARLLLMRQVMGDFVQTLVTDSNRDGRYLRIMLRAREQSDARQKQALINAVQSTVDKATQTEAWRQLVGESNRPFVSGYFVMLSELVSSVVADQWRCFAIATLGIWIAMSIALRSWLLPSAAILPNALPSLCILGTMGWLGMRVNLGAAMIAAVSMGLSVDSSLHYLIRIQQELSKGKSIQAARQAAQSDIGLAMILSTFALVIGLGALAVSDFLPTVAFGVCAALSMLGGLVGNLIILPATLSLFPTQKCDNLSIVANQHHGTSTI